MVASKIADTKAKTVTLKIDRRTVEVKEGTTILEAARSIGLRIPTLCYLKGINEVGACRMSTPSLRAPSTSSFWAVMSSVLRL